MTVTAISTASKFLTDEDNPLIDRKYPKDTVANHIILPQIYRFEFTFIPDFSHTVMRIEPSTQPSVVPDVVTTQNDFRSHNEIENPLDAPLVSKNVDRENPTDKLGRSQSYSQQSLNQKVHSKTLSTRQIMAQAKIQAKQREQQRLLEEEKRHAEEVARYQAEVEAALQNPKIHEGLLHQRKSIAESQAVVKKHAIFGELAQDLQTIQLPESAVNDQAKHLYQKAVEVANAVESDANLDTATILKALHIIQKFADNNIPDAMLRKALWMFEGNEALNISQDSAAALSLLQVVASQNDNRAEKLLSRLYYAGHLVEQNSEMGKYWLELAAAHGHPEAIRIAQGIASVSLLKETQREENRYAKKLGIGMAILIVLMILIFVMVKF